MMRFTATVEVTLREGIADPEAQTIERALPALGFSSVHGLRGGRHFSFAVDAEDLEAATAVATEVASRLLSNPVIEQHDVAVQPA